jgi:nucleoside-diphosphate-sugar epimerase
LLQVELLAPAVTGTMNVLKACSEAKVKRVVVVSSVAAVMMNPAWPQSEAMDEASWSDAEFCRSTQVILKKLHVDLAVEQQKA